MNIDIHFVGAGTNYVLGKRRVLNSSLLRNEDSEICWYNPIVLLTREVLSDLFKDILYEDILGILYEFCSDEILVYFIDEEAQMEKINGHYSVNTEYLQLCEILYNILKNNEVGEITVTLFNIHGFWIHYHDYKDMKPRCPFLTNYLVYDYYELQAGVLMEYEELEILQGSRIKKSTIFKNKIILNKLSENDEILEFVYEGFHYIRTKKIQDELIHNCGHGEFILGEDNTVYFKQEYWDLCEDLYCGETFMSNYTHTSHTHQSEYDGKTYKLMVSKKVSKTNANHIRRIYNYVHKLLSRELSELNDLVNFSKDIYLNAACAVYFIIRDITDGSHSIYGENNWPLRNYKYAIYYESESNYEISFENIQSINDYYNKNRRVIDTGLTKLINEEETMVGCVIWEKEQ